MLTPHRHLILPLIFPGIRVSPFVYLTCNSDLNFETDYSSVYWPFHDKIGVYIEGVYHKIGGMSNDWCFIDIIAMLYNINLFTPFASSTWQCCTISNQHCVDIVNRFSPIHRQHCDVVRYRINIVSTLWTILFGLHRSYRQYSNAVQYWINIVSTLWTFLPVYIVHMVDIVMLYNIKSISYRHREFFF
jgi:hypothetical protein